MSTTKKKKQPFDLKKELAHALSVLDRYKVLLVFVIVALLYGFIVWRINILSTAPASTQDVQTAEQSVKPTKIDPKIVEKIRSLQDNSERVQALFNDARNNPFAQ